MRLRWQSHFLWGGARGSASGLRQGSALHPRRVFDPLDTLFAIELSASAYSVRVFMQWGASAEAISPRTMKNQAA